MNNINELSEIAENLKKFLVMGQIDGFQHEYFIFKQLQPAINQFDPPPVCATA